MFDEEHRDEHDECRFEIDRLTARGRELELALQNYMDAMVYADRDTLIAAIAAAHKEALRLVPKRVYPSQGERPEQPAAFGLEIDGKPQSVKRCKVCQGEFIGSESDMFCGGYGCLNQHPR